MGVDTEPSVKQFSFICTKPNLDPVFLCDKAQFRQCNRRLILKGDKEQKRKEILPPQVK